MKIKKILFLLFYLSFLMFHCTPIKKLNIIAVYYQKYNSYADNEMIKNISQIAFNNNYKVIFKNYTSHPEIKIINNLYKEQVKSIILEDHKLENIKKIYKFTKSKNILLSLITSQTTSHADSVYLTDYKLLGYDLGKQLHEFSRSKRYTFVFYFKTNYQHMYYKKKLLEGYSEFLTSKNYSVITNRYANTNADSMKKDCYRFMALYQDNLRGIITDDDDFANSIVKFLRDIKKEIEIKVSSFNATMNGFDSIIKIGLAVTGDMNRYEMFTMATTNSLFHYNEIRKGLVPKYIYNEGVYYNQINILDTLVYTKKYSIQQIIKK